MAVLLSLDPALVSLVLLVWAWAGLRAGGLAHASTPRQLSRRAGRVLALGAVGMLLVVARVAVVGALATGGWWFVQEKVVLALPLLLAPAVATLVVSVPRLLAVRRSARALHDVPVLSPALRQQAAHPLLAWPIQTTAFAAVAGEVVFAFVSYPATPGSALAVLTGVAFAALVSWRRLVARHARLAGDVVIPAPAARLVRGTAIVTSVAVVAVGAPLAALVVAAPAAGAHADAGHGSFDLGGGSGPGASGHDTSLTDLRGRADGEPVRRFDLTARHAAVTLPSGSIVDALTYDGTVPGPELRVTQGDFVEVTLRNADIAAGVTIHWHGYDVPNGEDGVAGVTQDAVGVGGQFVYRFRVDQVGTFWYHSHQRSNEQIRAGLFGVLVVTPRAALEGLDLAVPHHDLEGGPRTLLGNDKDTVREVAAGTPVRLRLVNAANSATRFELRGASARLVALDGTDLNGPTSVTNPAVRVTAGGRADLGFVMPTGVVRLNASDGPDLVLRNGGAVPDGAVTEIDPLSYGTAAPTPFSAASPFDRQFTLVLDQKFARLNGVPAFVYSVNGNAFPEIPTELVRYGELVKFTIVGRGYEPHPIHPHGHHVLVLSRNGVPSTGSPLWMDTFDVEPGEVWEVALKADNPGIWMDHCHNLRHAAEGMVFHLAYEGVTTPYRMGRLNHPE